MMIDV